MSNFDPCECVDLFNHEGAMRRLINLLRDSQNACTDGGCEELPGDPSAPNCADGYMMLLMGWVVVATLLYFLRPKNLRLRGNEKPSPASGDGSDPPPPGPAVN
ncbi:small integral membrane protein 14 [Aplysia californica]|uniref:Small integral membrane protein 14 n=1 Tax=Aplysia californica TaxID=6500 RepID=A0ABM1VWJ4_APLCA|nr:small integral membrane protein 14 [Aplysia californica]XP_035826786.1 small integral membrane protein 14 [Aplysia californica]